MSSRKTLLLSCLLGLAWLASSAGPTAAQAKIKAAVDDLTSKLPSDEKKQMLDALPFWKANSSKSRPPGFAFSWTTTLGRPCAK